MSKKVDDLYAEALKELEEWHKEMAQTDKLIKDMFGPFRPKHVIYSSLAGKYIDGRTGEEWKPEEEQS